MAVTRYGVDVEWFKPTHPICVCYTPKCKPRTPKAIAIPLRAAMVHHLLVYLILTVSMSLSKGRGFPRNSIAWGGLNPPLPFFWGDLRLFFDTDTPFVRNKFLVVFFWTAHPKFCRFPPFGPF